MRINIMSAGLFYGAGSFADELWKGGSSGSIWRNGGLGRAGLHARAGCISGMLQGGSCGRSALAAGVSEAMLGGRSFKDGTGNENVVAGVTAHAVVGGTVSVIGGGNFANGAQMGAFGYLFNYCSHDGQCTSKLEKALWDWMPGYKLGTCMINGTCAGTDWLVAGGEAGLAVATAGSGGVLSGWFRGAAAAEELLVTRVTSTHLDAVANGGMQAAERAFSALPRVGEIVSRDIGNGVMVRSMSLQGGGTASLRTFSASQPSRPTLQINVPQAREIKIRYE